MQVEFQVWGLRSAAGFGPRSRPRWGQHLDLPWAVAPSEARFLFCQWGDGTCPGTAATGSEAAAEERAGD